MLNKLQIAAQAKVPGLKISWVKFFSIIAIALPPLVLVAALIRYSVNVPFWDQWELVTLIEKLQNGTAGFSDFFAQHNEHRIFFPRIIMVALACITSWNTKFEVAANVVLAAGSMWFLWLMLRKTLTKGKLLLAVTFLVSLILFSPVQFENWMWGWQIQWYLNIFGLIVAVWALTTWRSKNVLVKLIVAGLCATLATYSLASGFLVWLICVPILWSSKDFRHFLPHWIFIAAVVVGVHYIGYVDPPYHPSKLLFLQEPVQFLVYFLVYIGRPLTWDFFIGVPVAVVYLTAVVISLTYYFQHFKNKLEPILPWLCLGLYSLLAAISTDMSRLGLGVEQSYASRYVTLSMLFLISFIVILAKFVELSPAKVKKIILAILATIAILVAVNYAKGLGQMKERHAYLLNVKQCAVTATSENDDCLLLLYPDKQSVWPRLEYLRSIHWGGL